MHEVRVYDSSGNLKKVISKKKLTERSAQQISSPSLFRKNVKRLKSPTKVSVQVKAKGRKAQ